ncbi:MAG: hypothetical protein WAW85_13960 [Gordonia sp. (in: high G+C Gram-positive bacteria)]|uniref:hypothetical protein n=1 Tax=Gordonia sp. (in: high G+C Gram-positive bacteria) TaxID=84139 RepID=UPI003BB546ED
MTDETTPSGHPDLPSKYHQHASGTESHDPDAVHPQRPAGTPPPPKSPHRTRNLILSAVGAILALAVVIGVIAATAGSRQTPDRAAASSTAYQLPPKPQACVDGVPGGKHPRSGLDVGDVLVEKKSLPAGWTTTDLRLPLATKAQLLTSPGPTQSTATQSTATQSTVTQSTMTGSDGASADLPAMFGLITVDAAEGATLREVGDTFLRCLPYLPRYAEVEALPPVVTNVEEQTTENGVDYVHLAARLTIGTDADRGGDAVYLVAIGTDPRTIAVGIAPLGDEAGQQKLQQALSGLQIRAPQK